MTPLLDTDTGTLTFSNGLRLEALMAPAALSGRYATLRDREVFLEPCPVTGGTLAPVCLFQEGALVGVTLFASAVGGRERPGADRQRAFLMRRLHLKDPCPDTMGSVCVRCPFGEVLISTDPYTGQSAALISYMPED
ncbi:MAG TPA: hypothetical protein IAC11_09035 [Candidatus Limiplasma pullicola]|nr:hypothetical protein [Candidatus Limiplasma pullicola]